MGFERMESGYILLTWSIGPQGERVNKLVGEKRIKNKQKDIDGIKDILCIQIIVTSLWGSCYEAMHINTKHSLLQINLFNINSS